MKNTIAAGENITVAAPEAVTAGRVVKVGTLVGVAQDAAASGADVVLVRRGIFELTKVAGQAWAVGAKIYWDDTAKNCTTTAGSNAVIGCATVAALSADVLGIVLLDGAIR